MKNARFLFFLVLITVTLVFSGCKWTILSIYGHNCASTGETVTIYIEGTCTSEADSPAQYGLILQIPNSWLVISARAEVGTMSYNLTENPDYASLYSAEPGQKIWVGTATQSSNSTENGIATVVLSIGDVDGQVKVAAGSFRDGTWTTDDPAGEFDFSSITEQKYVHSISIAGSCIPNPPPTVTSVTPESGSSNGGTEITVHGSDFAESFGSGVTIGDNWISYDEITYGADGTWLRFCTPLHAVGAVDATVRNPDGQEGTLTDGYTYVQASPPTVTSVSPDSGSTNGGTEIIVFGTGFAEGSGGGVTIGGNWISYYSVTYGADGTWLQFNTPTHAAGAVDVTVRNPDGQEGTLSDGYTYVQASPPTVTSVSPDSGSTNGGTEIIVSGTDFVEGSGSGVTIGGTSISYYYVTYGSDGTWLRFDTPTHAAGPVDVTVRNPDGQEGTLADGYTYVEASPPTVTSVSPDSGASNGGTEITVFGTDFVEGSGSGVTIGGNWISYYDITYGSDGTWLQFDTPVHAAAVVDITVRNPDGQEGTLTGGYTYVADPTPSITSVSPDSGPSNGGTEVTVYGSDFVEGSGSGVTIGGTSVSNSITYGEDGTWLRFVTPVHLPGSVDVTARNPDGQEGTLSDGYTYIADSPPTINSVSPDSGGTNGGTEVTVYGSNFIEGSGSGVTIGGNSISYYDITYGADGTWLRFITPVHSAGTVDITVRNPDGQAAVLTDGYTYEADPAPTIASVDPTSGSSNGGTEVLISGSNFNSSASVRFGNEYVSYYDKTISEDGTWMSVDTPAHATGTVDVTVRNPDGQAAVLTDGYTYEADPAPTIASVDPTSGSSNGGTEVLISGSNFNSSASVRFGNEYVSYYDKTISEDGTWMSVDTPAHATGTVDVTVRNPDGQAAVLTDGYTYEADPAPTIASVDPTSGSSNGGTEVLISGSNFNSSASVRFGNEYVSYYDKTISEDGTWMSVDTPAHATGTVDVTVRNPDGQAAVLTDGYTYEADPAPTIASVDPTSGSSNGGTEVLISGSNFNSSASVRFGNEYVSYYDKTISEDGTWMSVDTPAHATGTVDVTVRNPDGQAAVLSDAYTYVSAPVVETTEACEISYRSATSGGDVKSDGELEVTARGVCWGTSINPTKEGGHTVDGSGAGVFASQLTGLNPGTLYHVRAYATNNAGTSYGDDLTFNTEALKVPSLTTTEPYNITSTMATSGGNITSDGGESVTAWGVCWSTSPNPTTEDDHTFDEVKNRGFVSFISGLNAGTVYHVRAYAINSQGTGYGQDIEFTTVGQCPECSGEDVLIEDVTFPPGTTCECVGSKSLTLGEGVIVEEKATVIFKAPVIKATSGAHVKNGATVKMKPTN